MKFKKDPTFGDGLVVHSPESASAGENFPNLQVLRRGSNHMSFVGIQGVAQELQHSWDGEIQDILSLELYVGRKTICHVVTCCPRDERAQAFDTWRVIIGGQSKIESDSRWITLYN
ncbi:hypothetical protein AAC387_Pa10g1974 [Persea americana]